MQTTLDMFFTPSCDRKQKNADSNEYILYFDGASRSNPGHASYGGVIYKVNSEKKQIELYNYKQYIGIATNNEAEYQGLLKGIQIAVDKKILYLKVLGDSKLAIEQVIGNWKMKSENLKPFYRKICALKKKFQKISFQHIYRKNNKRADELANEALDEANKI